MILTITLNVAIDKRYVVEAFRHGRIMRVKECNYTAGGKGLNVSRIARQLGEEVVATGFIGGHAGDYITEQLDALSIRTAFTKVPGESRSCINLYDEATGVSTELLEPGITVPPERITDFLEQLESLLEAKPVVCISGSAPQGVPVDIYPRMVRMAVAHGCPVLLDTSGGNLREGIAAHPDLIKPNRDEIECLLGKKVEGEAALIEAAQAIRGQGVKTVVVSLGADGALIACPDGVFQGITPPVQVVNTVGCGDSMVGAFACAIARGLPMEEGIRIAMAVSTANALNMETGYYLQSDFDRLIEEVKVVRLQ